jgi:hypothetical protein
MPIMYARRPHESLAINHYPFPIAWPFRLLWISTSFHLILRTSELPKCVKARSSPQGMARPLPMTATLQWRIWEAPVGQDDKRLSALLRSLELASASPALARLSSGRLSSC